MAEPSAQLSAAALRLVGHVGQTALDRITNRGVAAAAELDQHVAAVRAELAICQQLPGTRARLAGPVVNRASSDGACGHGFARLSRLRRLAGHAWLARPSRTARSGRRQIDPAGELQTRLAALRSTTARCPDVPFVGSALQAEPTVPVSLLLHYASGFVEAGLRDGWWPGQSADATDWVSLRLAAICQLISQAEAAGEAHPDLRTRA